MKTLPPLERYSSRGMARTPLPPRPGPALEPFVSLGRTVRPFVSLGQTDGSGSGPIGLIGGLTMGKLVFSVAASTLVNVGLLYLIQEAGWTTKRERLKAALYLGIGNTLINSVFLPMATGLEG